MKKLIEALHVIQDECTNHYKCSDCPMFSHNNECLFDESNPCDIDIDEVEVNLM